MRWLFVLSVIAAATMLATVGKAQNYPWCGVFRDGIMICSFTTFQQCLATVSEKLVSAYKVVHISPPRVHDEAGVVEFFNRPRGRQLGPCSHQFVVIAQTFEIIPSKLKCVG
jgi:hypothetical protein